MALLQEDAKRKGSRDHDGENNGRDVMNHRLIPDEPRRYGEVEEGATTEQNAEVELLNGGIDEDQIEVDHRAVEAEESQGQIVKADTSTACVQPRWEEYENVPLDGCPELER